MTILSIIGIWFLASFAFAALIARAGWKLSARKDLSRPVDMSWPGKPMRVIEGEVVPTSLDQRFRQSQGGC
jgi:hypothetical protein